MTLDTVFESGSAISIVLNLVLLLLQANLTRSMAELKVYMHQNFQPLNKRG